MKHCGFISDRTVCSAFPFILYSQVKGLLAESMSLGEAQQRRSIEVSRAAERGKESDALIFQWLQGQWLMCGDLYDLQQENVLGLPGKAFRTTHAFA